MQTVQKIRTVTETDLEILNEDFIEVCRVALRWLLDDRIEESELLLTLFRDYASEIENLFNQSKE